MVSGSDVPLSQPIDEQHGIALGLRNHLPTGIITSATQTQWPFQEPKLEVLSISKAQISGNIPNMDNYGQQYGTNVAASVGSWGSSIELTSTNDLTIDDGQWGELSQNGRKIQVREIL